VTGEERERASVSDELGDELDSTGQLSVGTGLRGVPQTDQGQRPALDPELIATLDDMNRRYHVARERIEAEDDAPEAAWKGRKQ